MRMFWLALLAASIALEAGCGSGGGSTTVPQESPGTVLVAVSTQAAAPGTVLYAVQFTLRLPAGVTVAADGSTGEVAAGVLLPADRGAFAGARYLPATAGAQGSVRVNIVDSNGFGVGELATIACTSAPAAALDPAGFRLEGFAAKDVNAALIPEVTPRLALATQ